MISDRGWWVFLVGLAVLGAAFYLLAPVLTPFLIAALFAYLGDPLADRLQDKGLKRTLAVVVVFAGLSLVIALAILLLLPVISAQLVELSRRIPTMLTWLGTDVLPGLSARLGIEVPSPDPEALRTALGEHWREAGDLLLAVLSYATRSGASFAGWLASLLLIPVIAFYLLRDWDHLTAYVRELLPRSVEPTVVRLAQESDEMLGGFLRGQLLVMIALGFIYSLGLWIIGLEFALVIGFIAGLVSFVPYLGFVVGILAAGVAMLFQTQDPLQLVPVAIVFTVGQLIEGMLLTPNLVGDRIRLHPVAVIFAVLAGGQLFGFVGVLVALPVAAVLAVIVRHLHEQYRASPLYGPQGPLSGDED